MSTAQSKRLAINALSTEKVPDPKIKIQAEAAHHLVSHKHDAKVGHP